MGKAIRILHVLGAFNRGGIEVWLLHLLRGIDRERFRLDFLVHTSATGALDEEIRALGSTILTCPYPARPWSYAWRLRRLLRQQGPYDVVHSHVHHFSGFVLRLAHEVGVPVRIAHSHTSEAPQAGLLRRGYLALMRYWLFRHATIYLSASRQAHEALFGSQDNRDTQERLLRCGIDLTPFTEEVDSPAVRAELGLPPDAFVLGHVGRFVPCKNHQLLVAITAALRRRVPNSYLLLVGVGELRPAIEEEAERRGVRDRVLFAGARNDVPRLLKGAMDVFVFPSLYEGLPLAAIEAQAAGLPCLLSDAISEETCVVASLVRRVALAQPAEVWADAVLAALASGSAISRAEALAAMVRSTFNIRNGVERLQQLYETARRESRR